MLINADFHKRVIVCPEDYEWTDSPQAGVERVMLDRIGGEQARATSIVKYARGAHFPKHIHPGGEEILVLSGIFSESGIDYPSGWYLRNPPGSFHEPYSAEGTVIFVKLWQMCPRDTSLIRINTQNPGHWIYLGNKEICPLFASDTETVWLERLKPNAKFSTKSFYGTELLVLNGELTLGNQVFPVGSWIRLPINDTPEFVAGAIGTSVYIKTGYLVDIFKDLKESA